MIRLIGLFLTVFMGVAIGKFLGFSDMGICIGAVVGASTFVITTSNR